MLSKSKIRTSFKNIVLINNTRKSAPRFQQPIRSKANWLIRDGKQKCFLCGGIPSLERGNITRFYLTTEIYPHQKGCENGS